MRIDLASQTVKSTLLVGAAVIALSTTVLLARNVSSETTANTNFAPCEANSNQAETYQQHHQWMAQQGSMMNPEWGGSGGWGHRGQYGMMYDSNTVETLTGKVVSVDTFTPIQGMSEGMHLQLQAGNETVDVHLGPSWYLENQDIKILPQDKITVTGSIITFDGQTSMIANRVTKGNATLVLRDENGFPMWSGWRQFQSN